MEKLISIIMNCYNGEKYLEESIQSILNQTYDNWELIFWDNVSTDNSANIFKSFNDKRFHYYLAKEHTTLGKARNLAIEKSIGDFLCFLDVDDYWYQNKLQKQLLLFEDNKVGIVHSNFYLLDQQNKKKRIAIKYEQPIGYAFNETIINYNIGFLTVMIRKKSFNSLIEKCNPNYSVIEDFDLIVRILLNWKIHYTNIVLGVCRIHKNNFQKIYAYKKINEFLDLLENYEKKNIVKNKYTLLFLREKVIRDKIIHEYVYDDKKISLVKIKLISSFSIKIKLLMIMIVPKFLVLKYFKKRYLFL